MDVENSRNVWVEILSLYFAIRTHPNLAEISGLSKNYMVNNHKCQCQYFFFFFHWFSLLKTPLYSDNCHYCHDHNMELRVSYHCAASTSQNWPACRAHPHTLAAKMVGRFFLDGDTLSGNGISPYIQCQDWIPLK